MNIHVIPTVKDLAAAAAVNAGVILKDAIAKNGKARIMMSTGASQLELIERLLAADIDWPRIEMFHLDEYIDLPETHPASFRKYLKERLVCRVKFAQAHFVNWEGDLTGNIRRLNAELAASPIDLGFIGIGENAHIAFNDPPADFEATEPYIIVSLADACKKQQVGEGWFPDIAAVPDQAVTVSVRQILLCRRILSFVPYKSKAEAIRKVLSNDVTNMIPATILKTHPQVDLYLDAESSSLTPPDMVKGA
ncbi:MAG: 6-phosphogluconolactonase [Planctomycetes bacterium]|nr:6-phosphogluconolactonase [Planctomycetota bacterium]